jgi:amidase
MQLSVEVIAGKDPMDPRQSDVPVQPYVQMLNKDLRGLRIGVLREGFGTPLSDPDVDNKVRRAVEALHDLGAQVEEVSAPAHLEAGGIIWALIAEGHVNAGHGQSMFMAQQQDRWLMRDIRTRRATGFRTG